MSEDSLSKLYVSRQEKLLNFLGHLHSNKWFIAGVIAIALTTYFWNAQRAIDDPEWDETYYLRRAIAVDEGNIVDANLGDLRNSPVMILYYAAWYKLVPSTAVYNVVLISGVWLMTYAAYVLMMRVFHPLLSGAFALLIAMTSTPQMPNNMRFSFGTALLWGALYLLGGKKPTSRALAVLVMLLAFMVRPEFLSCLVILIPGLCYFEWRKVRSRDQSKAYTLLAYAPVLILLAFTVVRLVQLSPYEEPRIVRTVPFSYGVYLERFQPGRLNITTNYDNQAAFRDDFGLQGKATLTSELIAMAAHLDKSLPFLAYNTIRLWGAFSLAFFDSWHWQFGDSFWVYPTWVNSVGFTLVALAFGIVSVLAYRSARKRHYRLPASLDTPSILGYIALAMLIPWLLIINPDQRAFMILPLVLLPVGLGITAIAAHLHPPRWLPTAVILAALIVMPRPFSVTPTQFRARDTESFIRENIPSYGVVVGTPIESYYNSLYANQYKIVPVDSFDVNSPVLLNLYKADPSIEYVLTTYYFPQDYYKQWFAEWDAAYPTLHWQLIAEKPELQLGLYKLQK